MFKITVLDITKAESLYEGLASCAIIPGADGELSILDFHQSMVACLEEGLIRIDEKKAIAIKRGVAKAEKNQISILVET